MERKNRMEGVRMHMVSEGRVVDWNDIKGLENGAMVQVMVNIQGGMGKRGKKKKDNNPGESDGGSGARSSIRRRSWKNIERCWETNTLT